MKKRLNLFSQRSAPKEKANFYKTAKVTAISLFAFLTIAILVLAFLFFYYNNKLEKVKLSKKNYGDYILANEDFSREIQLFVYKYKILKSSLEKDSNNSDYYFKLKELLAAIPVEKKLVAFELNNDREVIFSLNFSSYSQAVEFIDWIEKKEFKDNFESLTVEGFDVVDKNNTGFEVVIKGIYKKNAD